MIATADLCAMPTSLNDACRKMELAADTIDEAADIIDMLKVVIETELVTLGLPTTATPTSALGRARAFIALTSRKI